MAIVVSREEEAKVKNENKYSHNLLKVKKD